MKAISVAWVFLGTLVGHSSVHRSRLPPYSRGVATMLARSFGEIARARCPLGLKRADTTFNGKYFLVHQVASKRVSKWNMDVFNRFNGVRFSVAACNNFFGWCAPGALGKNLATMVLKCEKMRNKMWSFDQSQRHSCGCRTRP